LSTNDPRVDAYIAQAAPFARPILTHIRKVVHAGCPDVEETMKWSFPHFMYKGILCSMASFKAHCAFGFWKGSLLQDAASKPADAMGQFGRLSAVADLPGDKALIALVRKAAELNEQGTKVPRAARTTEKPAPEAPPDMKKALKANQPALAAWGRFSPSHQREYIEWITEATRQRRIATAVEWLAQGRSRNWKYERP
jgi:hypothetical protein